MGTILEPGLFTFLVWGALALLVLIFGAIPLGRMLKSRRKGGQ